MAARAIPGSAVLDPQVDAVRGFVNEAAERIATMGGTPIGTPAGSMACMQARSMMV